MISHIKYRIYFCLFIISINSIFSNNPIEQSRFNNLYYSIDDDSLRNHGLIIPYHKKNNFSLIRINPSAKIYRDIPDIRNNVIFYGKSNNFHFYIESTITNDFYKNFVLGSKYSRSNISGRVNNAFLKLYNEQISFQLGRAPLLWGSSSSSSIIQSSSSITYDHILLQLDLSNFSYELLTGQLGSEKTMNQLQINRYIAGHRLNWNISDDLSLGLGEQIIYTGFNRGIDLTYLNPFVPYFFSALEGDEKSEPYDNDNSIIFAYGKYKLSTNTAFYTEMIIDDYQVDKTDIENALGYKIGFRVKQILFNKKINSNIEWTKIDPWTYIHHGQYTTWQNKSHSIGFPYGSSSECFEVELIIDLQEDLHFLCDIIYLKKGRTYLNTNWDNRTGYKLEGTYYEYNFFNYSVIKKYKKAIIEAGWSFKPFPNTIAFNNTLFPNSGSLFFKMNLILDKMLNFM